MKWRVIVAIGAGLLCGVAYAEAGKLKVLEKHPPAYPLAEKAARQGGRVELRVSVLADGVLESVEVGASSGFPALDQAAVDAVKTWKFAPATDEQGNKIAARASFALTFKPPLRELDLKITCAELAQQVATLRAASPDADLSSIPALGAFRDLAEATDQALKGRVPEDRRVSVLDQVPEMYEGILDGCAAKPEAKVMEVHFEYLRQTQDKKKR